MGMRPIADLIAWHSKRYDDLAPDRPLFPSRKGSGDVAMTRKTGHEVLKAAFEKAGLNGKLATHSLRKSFAQRAYDASGDIYLVQQLLGHKDVSTTREYLGVSYQKMRQTVEAIETSKGNTIGVLLHSPDENQKPLVSEIQRQNQIIDRLTRMLQKQNESTTTKQAVNNDEKVIPIERARRAKR